LKYWRGFLVAGIVGACTWGFTTFAKNHQVLVDMVFPYVSRMITGGTATWSSEVSFCMWQALLMFAILGIAALVVMAIIFHWNLIRVSGWISAGVSIVIFLHVGIFGINQYAGPLADDIHLKLTSYSISELEDAAEHYLEEAKKAYETLSATGSKYDSVDFDTFANQAGNGFNTLVYDKKLSVFAG